MSKSICPAIMFMFLASGFNSSKSGSVVRAERSPSAIFVEKFFISSKDVFIFCETERNVFAEIITEKIKIIICRTERTMEDFFMEMFVSLAIFISVMIKSCMISENKTVIVRISSRKISFSFTELPFFICSSSFFIFLERVLQVLRASSSFS